MTTLRNVASIYNPDLLSKAQLIDSFVIRNKKFEKLFSDIKTSTMDKPEQPIMIVGLRGMGKTTLLRRLAYEVENDQALHTWLMPIIFNEEEYGITKLFKLWETIAEYVEKRDPSFAGLYDRMDAEYRKLKGDANQYEQAAFDILIEALHGHSKKLLLFIDNFGDMFRRFSKQEKQRLREILMTCSDLRIIAASAVVIEAFFKYDDPLFEFFKTERLDGLNSEETITLLLKLGEDLPGNPVKEIIEKQPQRVESLRRLTGGIPRSIVLFFEIFVNDKDGDAFTDLESVLDRVTPLYKHRMDDLPAQQQEILQVLALNYDSMNTREIAERTRLDSKLVSAQLKQLQQNNLVSIVHTGGKNHIYHVHDRFFNIWFLMRMARKGDKNRVLWLVRFLECWCGPEQLSKRSEAHRQALSGGNYDPESAYFMSTALYYASQEDIDGRYRMARKTYDYIKDKDTDIASRLETSDLAYFGRAIAEMRCRNWDAAYTELAAIKDKNAQDYLLVYVLEEMRGQNVAAQTCLQKAKEKGLACPERLIGQIHKDYIKDYISAEKYFQIGVKQGDAKSHRLLGHLYLDKYKNYKEAEQYYFKAIELGDAYAWISLGSLYRFYLKEYVKAEECYEKGVKEGHLVGWQYIGALYCFSLKEYAKAETFYHKAIEAGMTYAWINLGNLFQNKLKDYAKAEEFYNRAVIEGLTEGWNWIGNLYSDGLNDIQKAETYFWQAIEGGDEDAYNNLAWAYFIHKIKPEAAMAVAEDASKKTPDNNTFHTLSCIYLWNNRFEEAHETAAHFLYDAEYLDRGETRAEFMKYFPLLLAKKQYDFLYHYFTSEKGEAIRARDRFLPVWYALMYFMREQHPNEYLRMPPELKETVTEIIERAKEYAIAYQ